MILLGIEKAYDTVWLNGPLFQLSSLHMPDYLLFFLKSYLGGRTYTVHLNNSTSTPKPTPSGIPQGAVQSTTLFSLYLCYMPHPPLIHLAFTQLTLPFFLSLGGLITNPADSVML